MALISSRQCGQTVRHVAHGASGMGAQRLGPLQHRWPFIPRQRIRKQRAQRGCAPFLISRPLSEQIQTAFPLRRVGGIQQNEPEGNFVGRHRTVELERRFEMVFRGSEFTPPAREFTDQTLGVGGAGCVPAGELS